FFYVRRASASTLFPYTTLFRSPFADVFKLLTKELIVPAKSNKVLYLLAPVVTLMPALAAWAVIPFSPDVVLSDVNAGLLYILARSEEHTSELQSRENLVCRLLL